MLGRYEIMVELPTPSQMMIAYLDRFVHGQAQAKRTLCKAVYYHYLNLALRERGDEGRWKFQHCLLLGSTRVKKGQALLKS